MNPALRFWKKVFEVPWEIIVCFIAGNLGVIFLPLVILWNLTFERRGILISVQADLEREQKLKEARQKYPEKNPEPTQPREYFEKWADEVEGYILGGVAYHEGDDNFIYNDDTTQTAWGGFQVGEKYGEKTTLEGVARQFGIPYDEYVEILADKLSTMPRL